MSLFLTLLLSHLVADFPLQFDSIIRMKSRGQLGLILHSSIHVASAAWLLNEPFSQWPILLSLGLIHWLIDWTKISLDSGGSVTGFLLDQAAHVISIIVLLSAYGYLFESSVTAALPLPALYIGVLYGTILGCMVLTWVWANSLSEDVIRQYPTIQWTRAQMLRCSQQAGMALIGALVVSVVYFGQMM